MSLALALSLVLAQSIDGLKPGESLVPVPAGLRLDLEGERLGRVLDAATGRPLEGVHVESWTEDWELPGLLIDAQASGRDGTFRILGRRKGREADKLRLSRDGYRSTTRAFGEVFDDLLLVPGKAPASVVVKDLRGNPIAGALVTTRQTCAHGPSAIEAFSDADGRVDLSPMPPLDDEPELEVTVDGYLALRNLTPEDVFDLPGDEPTWLLGRKRPLRFRLLDPEGRPASQTRVLLGYAPAWHFTNTDRDGRGAFHFAFDDELVGLHSPLPGRDDSLLDFWSWDCGELVLRQDGDVHAREAAESDPRVVVEPAAPGLRWALVHEQGWRVSSAGTWQFPPGKVQVLVGGPFSGFVEQRRELELSSGTTTNLKLAAPAEPRLTVVDLPGADDEERWVQLVLEAAGHSVRVSHRKTAEYPVPPGVPVSVAVVSVRRPYAFELSPRDLSRPLDLTATAGWKAQPPPAELETLEIEVPDELAGLLRVRPQARGTRGETFSPGEEGWPIQVERGAAVEVALRADGHVPRTVVLPAGAPRPRIVADLVRCARVEIEGARVRAVTGLHDAPERNEDGIFVLADVAPGPLVLQVDVDGTWHALALELEPGERRKLTLR